SPLVNILRSGRQPDNRHLEFSDDSILIDVKEPIQWSCRVDEDSQHERSPEMTSPEDMTTSELRSLIEAVDARLAEQGRLPAARAGRARCHATTRAAAPALPAMAEAPPGLIRFRNRLDDALAARGA